MTFNGSGAVDGTIFALGCGDVTADPLEVAVTKCHYLRIPEQPQSHLTFFFYIHGLVVVVITFLVVVLGLTVVVVRVVEVVGAEEE